MLFGKVSHLVMWKDDNRSTPLIDVVWKGVPLGSPSPPSSSPHTTKSCDSHSRPSSGGFHHTGWMNPTKNWLQLCLRSLVPSFLLPHQGLRLPRSFLLTSSLCRESGGTSILIDYSPLPLLLGRSAWSFPSSPRTILTLRRAGWRCSAFELSILFAVEVAIFTASVFCRDSVFL